MSELEKAIANRVENNADLEGARELVDAHIDAVSGGLYFEQSFWSFGQSFSRYIDHQ
ncbi:MAG: hypothetical protein JO097_05725 [Acidobacteriaceae bacterium]|nr:hypothetical protein [Acidobacteriaceae bacterium]MBV9295299.1 hypothetical protein [Acidobacteriaceae bacterium]MBV9764886.1 hypothetical protein [Acidobacteriaceae bacterium]